jgi:transmembrane sensor
MPERFYLLISKKLNDTASIAEMDELEKICQSDSFNQREFQAIELLWNNSDHILPPNPEVFERHIQRLRSAGHSFGASLPNSKTETKAKDQPKEPVAYQGKTRSLFRWFAAAVMIGVVISLFWVAQQRKAHGGATTGNPAEVINEVQTRPGSRSKMVLPDGSQVWVNASSRLTYDQQFGRSHRNIQLDGEAYFIVEKNKDLPFVIQTQNVSITVTGTIFNVRAYDNENRTETALVEGSVQLQVKSNPGKIYRLKPSQKLVVNHLAEESLPENNRNERGPLGKSTAIVALSEVNYTVADSLIVETAWLYSTLAFSNESFVEVAQKMEKWYGIEIVFESSELEKIRFSGTFSQESVKEALEALQYTASFRFRRNGDRIIIYH